MRETFFVFGRKLIFQSAKLGDPHAVWLYADTKLGDQQPVLAETFSLIAQEIRRTKLSECAFESGGLKKDAEAQLNFFRRLKSHEQGAAIYAGALFVALNSTLHDLAKQLKLPNETLYRTGRKIGRSSLPQLIRAASNNFRHFEEWHKPKKSALENIRTLRNAGVRGSFEQNICAEVFEIIGWRSSDQMIFEIRGLMDSIYQLSVRPR